MPRTSSRHEPLHIVYAPPGVDTAPCVRLLPSSAETSVVRDPAIVLAEACVTTRGGRQTIVILAAPAAAGRLDEDKRICHALRTYVPACAVWACRHGVLTVLSPGVTATPAVPTTAPPPLPPPSGPGPAFRRPASKPPLSLAGEGPMPPPLPADASSDDGIALDPTRVSPDEIAMLFAPDAEQGP